MYFSRGNPVVYYGDEQGFTGAGGDQDARQDMFPSQDKQYNNLTDPIPGDDGAGKNDNIGSDATPMDDNFDPAHPLYRKIAAARDADAAPPARCATAPSSTATRRRRRASTRSRASAARAAHEYVVALNNAEQAASASIPTFVPHSKWEKVYGDGPQRLRSGARQARSTSRVGPLSTVVYRAKKHIPRSHGGAGARRSTRRPAGPRPARGRRGRRRQTRSTR